MQVSPWNSPGDVNTEGTVSLQEVVQKAVENYQQPIAFLEVILNSILYFCIKTNLSGFIENPFA